MAKRQTKKGANSDVTRKTGGGGADDNGASLSGSSDAVPNTNQFRAIARESLRLYQDWLQIMWGASERVIPPKDPRFADPAWHENPVYRRLAQGYLGFCEAVDSVVDENPDWRKRERARFLTGILTSSLAPMNTLLGNPAALKRAYETGGTSLLHGMQNMLSDMAQKKTTPTQVNPSAFKVGVNLAVTPGSVVFRNEMVELLQYRPTTATVREYPTLMIVPPIGKYYFMDLAPGRSFVEFAVSRGIQFFTTSWRNPEPKHAKWELNDYVKTCLEAVEAICAITNSPKVNILGLCAGGIIATLMLNYMVAMRDTRINVAAFGVTLLDFESEAPIAAFHSKPLLKLARHQAASKGILPASSLSSVFAWMRPNDLVWNYWCNNYLMGKDPPSFDILAWSVDGTNLPAALHGQFLDISRTMCC
jgi:polyhydroxyalkanoate synthase